MNEVQQEQRKTNAISSSMETLIAEKQQAMSCIALITSNLHDRERMRLERQKSRKVLKYSNLVQ